MIKRTLVLILTITSLISGQEKYFIYFKDKGANNNSVLQKTGEFYQSALNKLSSHAIERRYKNMGDDIIKYEDIPVYKEYKDELNNLGIKIIRELNWFNSVSAYLNIEQVNQVKALKFVKSVDPVRKIYFNHPESENDQLYKTNFIDPSYNYGYSFNQVDLSEIPFIHSKGIDGDGVTIGILDAGFNWKTHESLKDRKVIAEYDFVFDDSITANQAGDAPAQDSHGTFVFSVLAGYKDSVLIGPAFGSNFILAKTEDIRSETNIEEDNFAAALIWMESLGVDLVTASLGYNIFDSGYSYSYNDMDGKTTIVTKAMELAFERGVSTFVAAGNEGNNSWKYIIAPADGFNIISVGAVNSSGILADFSSIGPTFDKRIKPEVVALGVNSYGAVSGSTNQYIFGNGTSFAAPIAAGIGALLLSFYPHLTNAQIRSIILKTASHSGNPDNQTGYGIISAKKEIEFPNLQSINNTFTLRKALFNDKINPETVKIIYNYDGVEYPDIPMERESGCIYKYSFPLLPDGKEIRFYITYSDSLNNQFRFPEEGEYKFNYGSNEILKGNENAESISEEISDFYPNPFVPIKHKKIKIDFYSAGNETVKILIIDASGQKVLENNFFTIQGTNHFLWDGISSQGNLCASGVYYALIQISGKEFGKKFVLLK